MPVAERPINGRALVAANLRRLRAVQGLSQEALAGLAGIHRTDVGSVQRAEWNVSIDNIFRLAAALHVDVGELLAPVRKSRRGRRTATGSERGRAEAAAKAADDGVDEVESAWPR